MILIVRRLLAWGVALSLLLPLVLILVLSLGGLLTGVGDNVGGSICLRASLCIGVIWATAVVVTAVTGGLLALETGTDPSGSKSKRADTPQDQAEGLS
ncbi:MAG: hypothetical protein RLZZ622_197 [Planctomycetota bacterium]|jgi:hypothetical protein